MVTVAVHPREVKVDLGVLKLDDDSRVLDYIEKPTYKFDVSMGIYVFDPKVLAFIPHDEYLDFPNLILKLIAAGELVKVFRYDGYWMDLGRPDDYEQAVADFERMRSEFLPESE
jgi:NDP-sugar pyrophosphorylase family protein